MVTLYRVKILGVHYSYNKKHEKEKNFKNHVHKIETVKNLEDGKFNS